MNMIDLYMWAMPNGYKASIMLRLPHSRAFGQGLFRLGPQR
jgi:hypothetical protein